MANCALATEVEPFGIATMIVEPGFFRTEETLDDDQIDGDEDDGDGQSGATGNPALTGTGGPSITTGGQPTGGTATVGSGNYAGGMRAITPDEESAIEDAACAGWSGEPEPLPSRLMLVVDVSSSMNSTTPATGGRTKWEVTREALLDAVSNLPGSATAGLLLYPNRQTNVSGSNNPGNASDCVETDALVPFDVLGGDGSPHRERRSLSNPCTL